MEIREVLTAVALALVLGCHRDGPAVVASGRVEVTADEKGFTPSSLEVKRGTPVTLVFTRTTDDTCANQVVFPELKVTKDLPLRTPVAVDVPAGAARTLTFQCGMGMFKGKILID